jgi:hypothetical protein
MFSRLPALPAFAALAILAAGAGLRAEGDELSELRAAVRAMQKTIAEQNARIAELEKRQRAARPEPERAPKTAQGGRALSIAGGEVPVAELPPAAMPRVKSAVRDADMFTDVQRAAPRAKNAPLDPELKGFIPIPGTDTMFKIGGWARVDAITDLRNNGNPNQFVPSSIPVPGQPGSEGGNRSTLHTKGTRLSFELRRPVPFDDTLRIYSEFDFFGDSASAGMNFRTRHFYGQVWNFLVGQTFSAFMDADAFPDVLDHEGPNAIVNRRQPQLRYTLPVYEGASSVQLFASIEQPVSEIQTGGEDFPDDASVVSRLPDGVVGVRWEGRHGHLQGAAVFRGLSYESDSEPGGDAFGWGTSLGGSLNVFERDKLSAQVTYGEGVARYINDLSGQNYDAALDGGRLRAIPVFAATGGYTHQWTDRWRSTVSGGFVWLDCPDSLGSLAIDNTIYGSANLVWQPTKVLRVGLEYLYGRKETSDGSKRDAHRFNFVLRYDLVR